MAIIQSVTVTTVSLFSPNNGNIAQLNEERRTDKAQRSAREQREA